MLELRRVNVKINNLSETAILTVIIPIRAMQNRDIIDRLTYCIQDGNLNREQVDFLVVDDGSDSQISNHMLTVCETNNINYIYLDTKNKPFSIARARNIGAMYAKSRYIMFMDVDLYPYDGFYNELLNEIKIQKLNMYANDFIMVGVIYLTKEASIEYFNINKKIRKNFVIQKLLENDESFIEKFSTGTSVCLYNRRVYLSHGGNDEDFEEWGYDDLEFNLRMIKCSNKFPFPEEINLDYKNFRTINEYKGWKSVYRLYGDITFQKGIYLTHVWHEIDHNSNYMKGKEKNRKLFEKKQLDFKRNAIEPDVIPCMNSGKTLVFSKTNPFIYNRIVLSFLGIINYASEDMFDENSILKYLDANNIDKVLMFNPYGSEHRLKLYRALRSRNIPVLVAERGALRDSVFYDWNGFNAESTSYNKEYWDIPLAREAYEKVDDYISLETRLDISLEKQTSLVGANEVRKNLNISIDKKILFVPLQRPSDSVIKYFCGPIGTYADFMLLVQDTINALDDDWSVVVKKHPLEDEVSILDGAVYTEANIKDLLEMCDAVLLINSGVGLLSMLWNKPVFYCGDIFYNDDRINRQVTNVDDLLKLISSEFIPDKETVYRFMYFLLEDFYSFGDFTTKEVTWEEGGRMTVTTAIDFYQIRNISEEGLNFYIHKERRIERDSILFDRYNGKTIEKVKNIENKVAVRKNTGDNTSKGNKKVKKFKESPERFFKDSKNPLLRMMGKIFW